jgi:RNA polymerase subunit RPABC4/transcription elongation factor Spt4
MAYCPNCHVAIAKDAEDCEVCGTAFGADRWLSLDVLAQPGQRLAAAGLIFKLGLLAVLLPLLGFVLGLLLTWLIPGCQCDPHWGCRGCAADALTELLYFGGFDGALFAVVFVLPVAAVLAAALALLARRHA